jgi:hypothetical protein
MELRHKYDAIPSPYRDDTQLFSESPFCNPHTQTRPLISHVVGGSRESAEPYRRVGRRIMERGDDAAADGASR